MQIKLLTDYAIRFVLYLAEQGHTRPVPGSDIAVGMGISPGYIRKVAQHLRRAGIVGSDQGFQGGFYLLRDPGTLSLYEVLAAAEDTMRLNRCLDDPKLCGRGAAPACKVHQYLGALQKELEVKLRRCMVADLIQGFGDSEGSE